MRKVTINSKEYEIPEIGFDAVCELEENGVDLLAMDSKHPKLATTLRGIVAWVMGVDNRTASREIEAHIKSGGNLIEILEGVTAAMSDSGFFGRNEAASVTPMPRDHQRKNPNKAKNQQRNTDASQTL